MVYHNIHFIKLGQDNFLNILSNAFKNVDKKFNPFINTILTRNIIKRDHHAVIHIGDSDVDFNLELFL